MSAALVGPTALALTGLLDAQTGGRRKEFRLYVGTYTSSSESEGIYSCRFDPSNGTISLVSISKNIPDPSFMAVDPTGKYLVAVNELLEYEGKPGGSVSSFAIDRRSGSLEFLNRQPSMGGAPCHISITRDSKFILVANYLGGNIAVFPLAKNGRIGSLSDLRQHSGSGPNKDRQLSAHAHSITLDYKGRFAVAADLGIDRVMVYAFDRGQGKLKPNPSQPFFKTAPGSGPRHFAFHPGGRLAFIINELSSSVTSLSYDGRVGTLKEIQTLSTLSPEFSGPNTCADIHVSPNGKFLYGSNRGSDSIAAFKIDEESGKLTYIANTSTGGKKPRNFVIDPTGSFLLAANQDSDNIVVFRIDRSTGMLHPTGQTIDIPKPVCLKFVSP